MFFGDILFSVCVGIISREVGVWITAGKTIWGFLGVAAASSAALAAGVWLPGERSGFSEALVAGVSRVS